MTRTGADDDVCPYYSGSIVSILNEDGSVLAEDDELIWDIELSPDGKEVSFRVDNPYKEDAHIYVGYNSAVGSRGAYDHVCGANRDVAGCSPDATQFTALCYGQKHARVTVHFVSDDPVLLGDYTEDPDLLCCAEEDADTWYETDKVKTFVFKILCVCPPSDM